MSSETQRRDRVAAVHGALVASAVSHGGGGVSVSRVGKNGAVAVEMISSHIDPKRAAVLRTADTYLLLPLSSQPIAADVGDASLEIRVADESIKVGAVVGSDRGGSKSSDLVLESVSPSGARALRIRETMGELWAEVWDDKGHLLRSGKLSDSVSKIHDSPALGGVSWQQDESRLCFTGEAARPKGFRNWYNAECCADDRKAADDEFRYEESFGETLDSAKQPAVFVLDIESLELIKVAGAGVRVGNGSDSEATLFPEGLLPLNPQFDPLNGGVLFQGMWLPTRRIGLNFCLNKESGLHYIPRSEVDAGFAKAQAAKDKKYKDEKEGEANALEENRWREQHPNLVEGLFTAFSAKFSQDGERLLFFGRQDRFVSHSSTYELFCAEWKILVDGQLDSGLKVVVPRFPDLPVAGQYFAGIYGYHASFEHAGFLPKSSKRWFVFQTQVAARTRIFRADLDAGKVEWLDLFGKSSVESLRARGQAGEYDLMQIRGDTLIFRYSTFNMPPETWAATFSSGSYVELFPLSKLDADVIPRPLRERIVGDGVQQRKVTLDNGAEAYLQFSLVQSAPRPCVTILHGGPFGASPRDVFALQRNVLLAMGCAVLIVNYSGSTSFGERFLNRLLGAIGRVDVNDCGDLVEKAVKEHSDVIDARRVAVYGGSHGGFLTGHLVSSEKYKDLFCAGVMWNAVLNLSYNAERSLVNRPALLIDAPVVQCHHLTRRCPIHSFH